MQPGQQNGNGLHQVLAQPIEAVRTALSASASLTSVNPTVEASIDRCLDAWLESAPMSERASRTIVTERILKAHCDQATSLNLDNLALRSLPDCLKSLPALKTLQIRANFLTALPDLPANLIALKAGANQLTSLPELPQSLRELSIYRNCLLRLPILPHNLVCLHAYENRLFELPELPPSLERLVVSGNALNQCPPIHKALTLVNFSGNFLKNLPHQLLLQVCGLSNSVEVLRQYQRQISIQSCG